MTMIGRVGFVFFIAMLAEHVVREIRYESTPPIVSVLYVLGIAMFVFNDSRR